MRKKMTNNNISERTNYLKKFFSTLILEAPIDGLASRHSCVLQPLDKHNKSTVEMYVKLGSRLVKCGQMSIKY